MRFRAPGLAWSRSSALNRFVTPTFGSNSSAFRYNLTASATSSRMSASSPSARSAPAFAGAVSGSSLLPAARSNASRAPSRSFSPRRV